MGDPRRNYSSPDDAIAIDLNTPGGYMAPDGAVAVAPAPVGPGTPGAYMSTSGSAVVAPPPTPSMASTPSLRIHGSAPQVPRNQMGRDFWESMDAPPRVLGDGSMRISVNGQEWSIPRSDRSLQAIAAATAGRRFPQRPTAEGAQDASQAAADTTTGQAGQATTSQPGQDMSALLNTPPPQARRSGAPANPYAALAQSISQSRSGGGAGQPTNIPDPFQTLADREQRIQGERDAGNAQVNQQSEALNQQNMAEEQARQDDLRRRAQAIDAEIDRVSNMRVDPNNWFASRGTVGAIGAALAVGLGAAAQSLQGGQNNALGIINAAIDRDMQAQEQNLRAAGQRVGERQNALQQLRAQYGDERTAREAYRMRSLQIAERMAAQRVERAATPTARELEAQKQAEIVNEMTLVRERLQGQLMLQQNQQEYDARKAAAALAARRSGGSGARRDDPQLRVAFMRQIQQRMPNATPEQVQTALNNAMTLHQRGELGKTPEGMALYSGVLADEGGGSGASARPGQAVTPSSQMAEARSMINAELAQSNRISGIGPIETTMRQLGQSPESGLVSRLAGATYRSTVGVENVNPGVLSAQAIFNDMRRQLNGAVENRSEAARVSEYLPVITDQMSEADVVRLMDQAAPAIAQAEQLIAAEEEAKAARRRQPQQRQSVLSSGRGRR